MNLLLLERDEVRADGTAALPPGDRRLRHLRSVLRAGPGESVRAGIVDGALGTATITAIGEEGATLACAFAQPPPPSRDVLVLAVPRPKVLLRCVATAAALGFAKVLLVRTWRTDRSHVEASALSDPALRQAAIDGLEQARRTKLPRVTTHPLFKPFVEDQLDALCGDAVRITADPDAPAALAELPALPDRALALAIGPERGFTPYERDALAAQGFDPRHAGRHPLRVETALAVAFAQLDLLRARR